MHKLLIGAAAAALLASPALAADLYVQPAPSLLGTTSAVNWSGFYVGANVGFGWSRFDDGVVGSVDGSGLLGGVQAGYNYDFGGLVLGVEGDFQLSDVGHSEDVGGGNTGFTSVERFGTLRARAGVAVDRFMPYVTGGVAYGRVVTGMKNGVMTMSATADQVRWTVGGGVEYAAFDNVSFKAEYLYADFGSTDFGGGGGVSVKTTAHVLRAGLNYKF